MILETPVNILTPVEVVTTGEAPAGPAAPLPPTSASPFEETLSKIAESGVVSPSHMHSIPMTLFSDHVEITLANGSKRQVSYQGLKEIVDRGVNVREVVTEVEGMSLPSNVFFLSQSAKELRLCCYFPGGNRDMIYNESKMHIVAPNIIISHILRRENKDWIVASTNYMCTDLPISKLPKIFIPGPSSRQGIYLLPMSNTYSEGNMCYGNNSMPARFKDNQFRGLDYYFKYLWETPFNADLGIRAIGGVMSPGPWYTLLAKLAKENKGFPYCDLSGWSKMEGAVPSESAVVRDR